MIKKTAIVFSKRYLNHDTGSNQPESARRLKAIMVGLAESRLLRNVKIVLIKPKAASIENLQLVHSPEYIRLIKKTCDSGGGALDENTIVSRKSFDVARLAVGGVIKAVDKVMVGEFRNAFVISRPPGHHAGSDYALGFCIFNNVAVAAAYLLKKYSVSRVLILDFDSHHGNGTQEIFYNTDRVLYISLHEDPSEFPEEGFLNETGEGKGLGFTVNIPFPFRTGDPAYLKAIKTIVIPVTQQYRPQFILVSAGFDGYYKDRIGELSLSAYIYPRIFQIILDLAHNFSKDKFVTVLEGGYKLRFLRKIVPSVIAQMAGLDIKIRDERPFLEEEVQREAERVIKTVKKVQSSFWSL